jgi:CYTH domain-containing protein
MALEIERKFLVKSRAWQREADAGRRIRQAYLSNTARNSVRVRIIDDKNARLTIKSGYRGIVRDEFEYEIPAADAREMLALRQSTIIDKVRYKVEHAGRVWEVDEFFGANAGLVLAEIELDDENHALHLPAWVGREVTGDKRFNNSQLAVHPFGEWARHDQAVR